MKKLYSQVYDDLVELKSLSHWEEWANSLANEVEEKEAALKDARTAIASLDDDAFGIGRDEYDNCWYLKDELLAKIDKSLV